MTVAGTGRALAVGAARRDGQRFARAQEVPATTDHSLHLSGDDLELLVLVVVHVRLHEKAVRPPDHLEDQRVLAAAWMKDHLDSEGPQIERLSGRCGWRAQTHAARIARRWR
jgi:hypothetical protein